MPLVKDDLGRNVVPLFIDGKSLSIDDTRVKPVSNSMTDNTVHYYCSTDLNACAQACEAAWRAFSGTALDKGRSGWKRSSAVTRRNIILKAAEAFEIRKDELIKAQMDETSCQHGWAVNNVLTSVGRSSRKRRNQNLLRG